MSPTYANGKICYVEIPAADVEAAARFYESVFGWQTRRRGDGELAFDDGVGQVSGTWVAGRTAYTGDPGVVVHIMVEDAAATLEAITARGGTVVQPIDPAAAEIFAYFRDPDGNLFGVYQERTLAAGHPPVGG